MLIWLPHSALVILSAPKHGWHSVLMVCASLCAHKHQQAPMSNLMIWACLHYTVKV